jgi:hypothetical protein
MIQAILQSIAAVNNLLMPGMHTPTHYFMGLCCCEDRSRLSNSCSSPQSTAMDCGDRTVPWGRHAAGLRMLDFVSARHAFPLVTLQTTAAYGRLAR